MWRILAFGVFFFCQNPHTSFWIKNEFSTEMKASRTFVESFILSKGFPTSLSLTLSVSPSYTLQLNHVLSQLENSAKFSIKLFLPHPCLQPTPYALPTSLTEWDSTALLSCVIVYILCRIHMHIFTLSRPESENSEAIKHIFSLSNNPQGHAVPTGGIP